MKPDWAVRLQRTFERRYQAGVLAERERIIKLLSEDSYDAYVATDIYMNNFEFKIYDGSDVMDVNSVDMALKFYKDALIALIK